MDNKSNNYKTLLQNNNLIIMQDEKCEKYIYKMREVEQFMNDFSFLTFGRDYILCGNRAFSLQTISNSCELTLGSIISCCEYGCVADAYALLRKYRDDVFFYLYIVIYDMFSKVDPNSSKVNRMQSFIEKWINDELDKLYFSSVLSEIAQFIWVKDAVKKYNLKSYFDELRNQLNDYVHGNGPSFYNRIVNPINLTEIQKQLQSLQEYMRYITITFLFLLTLCSPLSIMSSDNVDYPEYNMDPPEGSQYWVAPFINDFFKSNNSLIDDNCMEYLRDNTCMVFD